MMTKTVLITGASRGIGAACVRRFNSEGYRIALACNAHREEALELASTCKQAQVFFADFSKENEVLRMCREVQEWLGTVDVIVNNAGVSSCGLLQDCQTEEYDRVMTINLKAPFLICRSFVSDMIRRQKGFIVNVSSMWGQTGASTEVVYSASKAGLIGFTKALAKEVAPSGVRVNCVCPGAVDTDMMKEYSAEEVALLREEIPLGRLAGPDEIASAIYFLASEDASYITGQILSPNGGILA